MMASALIGIMVGITMILIIFILIVRILSHYILEMINWFVKYKKAQSHARMPLK